MLLQVSETALRLRFWEKVKPETTPQRHATRNNLEIGLSMDEELGVRQSYVVMLAVT